MLENDVRDAISMIGPGTKSAVLDWVKRVAFLLLGIAIPIGKEVFFGTVPAAKGQIGWFTGLILAASILLILALTVEVPTIRRRLFRTRR